MKKRKNWLDTFLEIVVVIIGAFGVLIPISPIFMPLTYRDSGVFLYSGWRILSGDIPYLHIWDHKPPVIYYLNAIGLSLSQNSRWGVWLIELIFLILAGWIGVRIIKRALGLFPAIFSFILMMITLVFVIQGGNLTTEYSMLLQFIALVILYEFSDDRFSFTRLFVIGFIGAVTFFTKQTAIGIWIALGIYLLILRVSKRQIIQLIKESSAMILGGFSFSSIVILYFGVNFALREFISAAFTFNFYYSRTVTGLTTRLWPLVMGIHPLARAGLLQFGLIGLVICVVLLLNRTHPIWRKRIFFSVAVISFPIDLLLISASGYSFPHYYMTLLPVLFIFSAFPIWCIFSYVKTLELPNKLIFVMQFGMIGIIIWSSFFHYREQVLQFRGIREEKELVIEHIKTYSAPDDYVLIWGAETAINFFAERQSPSRFVYQYPLYTVGYVNEDMISEFLSDIIDHQPVIIIDTENPSTPFFKFPLNSPQIQRKIEEIKASYQNVERIGSWTIYHLIN